ncbi:MAG: CHRD domain-containing protein [Actinomycetota bacterium]|nr:CHRD domain-containing protein [Actinomycetota bacterium]
MKRRLAFLVALAVPVAGLAASPAALAGPAVSKTTLTGAEEAPNPGDPDATGVASLKLNQGQGTVCFKISFSDIDGTVTAAHIHEAPPGEAGPVVVELFSGSFDGTESVSGCAEDLSRAVVKDIRKNPEDYYVNVHSTAFPSGAVRGQLGD